MAEARHPRCGTYSSSQREASLRVLHRKGLGYEAGRIATSLTPEMTALLTKSYRGSVARMADKFGFSYRRPRVRRLWTVVLSLAVVGGGLLIAASALAVAEDQKLTSSDGASLDHFGVSVAISGDTAVIGADDDDDAGSSSGSAYVFIRSGTTWSEQTKLIASDGVSGDRFGWSVALAVDTAVIGAEGYDSGTGSA